MSLALLKYKRNDPLEYDDKCNATYEALGWYHICICHQDSGHEGMHLCHICKTRWA